MKSNILVFRRGENKLHVILNKQECISYHLDGINQEGVSSNLQGRNKNAYLNIPSLQKGCVKSS